MPDRPGDMDDERYVWGLSEDIEVNPPWASRSRNHSQSRANDSPRGSTPSDAGSSSQNDTDGITELSNEDDMNTIRHISDHRHHHYHHHQRHHRHRRVRFDNDDDDDGSSSFSSSTSGSYVESRPTAPVDLPSDLNDTPGIWDRNDPDGDDHDTISIDTTAADRVEEVLVSERQRQPYRGRRQNHHAVVEEEEEEEQTATTYIIPEDQRHAHSQQYQHNIHPREQPNVFDYLQEPPNVGLRPATTDPRRNDDDEVWPTTSRSSSTIVELPVEFPTRVVPDHPYRHGIVDPLYPSRKEHRHSPPFPEGVRIYNTPPLPRKKEESHGSKQSGGGKKHQKKKTKDNWARRLARYAVT